MKVVLATRNQGKIRELTRILRPLDFEFSSQIDHKIESPDETGLTFLENALIKARAVSKNSGLPSIADDSGISAPALGGAPGIYSARFAGEKATDQQNNLKLIRALEENQDARACYYCALVFIQHELDPAPIVGIGKWQGHIIQNRRGSNGFGYDPHFWLEDFKCTAAELTPDFKNKISHRAKAAALLIKELKNSSLSDA